MTEEFTKINGKNYFKFVTLTIFSMVFISIYTMTDGIFVSNKLGSTGLAALNVTIPAKNFISGLLFMVVIGSSAIIGINMGANDNKTANKNFTNMIYALIGIAIFDLIIGLYFTDDIAKLLGATETMMPYAVDYLYIQFVCGFCFVSKILLKFSLEWRVSLNCF